MQFPTVRVDIVEEASLNMTIYVTPFALVTPRGKTATWLCLNSVNKKLERHNTQLASLL